MSVTLTNSSKQYDWRTRPETDFYPTPSEVTVALLNFLQLPQKRIWEPACGKGHMGNVLKQAGHLVCETDIQNGVDFLEQTSSFGAEWIVTNPPFIIAEKFIRKCIELKVEGFALLLKSQYWHSRNRVDIFKKYRPKFVLPLTWRPDFLFGSASGSPTMEVLWTVWNGECLQSVYEPLLKPKGLK